MKIILKQLLTFVFTILLIWIFLLSGKESIKVKVQNNLFFRGTFIEYRAGMLNISPIGRNCSREERNAYEQFDLANNVRKNMIAAMQEKFAHLNLKYSIGGQISFDLFPQGWDKTFCLNHIPESEYDEIHFFGDKTYEGGNDYEIFVHPRVKGHTVTSPEDTIAQCKQLFGL